eukprot:3131342-Pyramimonas_sp.AAC.1
MRYRRSRHGHTAQDCATKATIKGNDNKMGEYKGVTGYHGARVGGYERGRSKHRGLPNGLHQWMLQRRSPGR